MKWIWYIPIILITITSLEVIQEQYIVWDTNNIKADEEFNSLLELSYWLTDDKISERNYFPLIYDCEQFCHDLILNAAKDGYKMGIKFYGRHAWCTTVINNETFWINVEQDWIYRENGEPLFPL